MIIVFTKYIKYWFGIFIINTNFVKKAINATSIVVFNILVVLTITFTLGCRLALVLELSLIKLNNFLNIFDFNSFN